MDAGLRCIRSTGPSHRGAYRAERARRWTDDSNYSQRDRRHPIGRTAPPSLDAWVALSELARSLGLPQPKFDGNPLAADCRRIQDVRSGEH